MAESSDNASKQAKAGPPPMPRSRPVSGGLDNEIDAVADLFRADQTLRAPSLPAEPRLPEPARRRTSRASLFEESVADPLPVPPPSGAVPSRSAELRQPGAAGASAERESTRRSGVRDRARSDALELVHSVFPEQKAAPAPPALPVAPAAPVAKGEPEQARRRIAHGPRPAVLALLGGAAVITLSTVAMVLGLIPKPWADQTQEVVGAVARPNAPAPPPAPQPKPVAAPLPVEPKAEAPAPAPATTPTPTPAPSANVAPTPAASANAAPTPAPSANAAPSPATASPTPAPTPEPAPNPAPQAEPSASPTPAPAPVEAKAAEGAPAAAPASEPAAEEPAAAADNGKVLASARKLLASDEPEKAEALLRAQLALDPSDHHTMELLARALMDQDRGPEAVPFAKKIVQRRPKRVPYRLLLGDLLLMVGDEAGAHAEWKQALALAPGNVEIQRRLK